MTVRTGAREPDQALPAELIAQRRTGPPTPFPGRGHHYAFGRNRLQAGMHGLTGMGQCDPTDIMCVEPPTPIDIPTPLPPIPIDNPVGTDIPGITDPVTAAQISAVAGLPPAGWNQPTSLPATATPPTPPNGYQWATLINSAGQTMARVLAVAQGGGAVSLPNGYQMVYGSPGGAPIGSVLGGGTSVFASMSGMMPLLLLGGLVLVVMSGRR